MGMFVCVNVTDEKYTKCFHCGEKLTGFQSKNTTDVYKSLALQTVEMSEVGNFYTSCKKCGHWNEFVAQSIDDLVASDFILKIDEYSECADCKKNEKRLHKNRYTGVAHKDTVTVYL